jgi:hypothetical protein
MMLDMPTLRASPNQIGTAMARSMQTETRRDNFIASHRASRVQTLAPRSKKHP